MSAFEVRATSLARDQAREAGNVLSRAFWDDPMITWLLPDEGHRAKANPEFFHSGALIGLNGGDAWATFGKVDGAAIWMPPGKHELSDELLMQSGFEATSEALGPEAMEKFGVLMAVTGEQHEAIMHSEPHWYLLILGVEPARQGQGVGGDLIRPVLARADEAGLPCYLETMKERNLAFYGKHGFEVANAFEVPEGGPMTWFMRRAPRT